ncbi:MAG: pirin family protein [Bdellovibrionales bacterium]|nr:pirin family protein [Bdellovibrionales bacterium]
MKKLAFIKRSNEKHWVGDGFHVRGIFSYNEPTARHLSPFLLMDYAEPTTFPPTEDRLGVGEHPHRGFETVTIVHEGEVEHRDSSGGGGKIAKGDVQWMTAASGLVHEEFHGTEYAKKGGPFEMIQLWVNLPKKDKMAKPGYQGLTAASIPEVALEGDAGTVRVIAGEYRDRRGPARTFTPMNVWDVRLEKGAKLDLNLRDGWTTALFVLDGKVKADGTTETVGRADLAVFERTGDRLAIEALESTKLLFLNGEPIDEPIAGYGPFVMNTPDEIRQAILDFQNGKMGQLT